ncbi:MAG TPA: hypothetical protein VFA56_10220 [Gaiellaceae bacterium]|nr:hypothetical protein [Gaiellaceae bacterium]
MRTATVALAVAAALGALFAAPASGRQSLTHQVDVTVTDNSCVSRYQSVSRRNTTILFHVMNNGTVPHGFTIWGVRSGFILPHQEGQFMIKFRGPGTYAYTCVTQKGVFRRGTFTIRRS